MPLHDSSTRAHHQEVNIALHSLWYHHTYRWPSHAQIERVLSQPVHRTATYRCDDTKGCIMQFWPPDDEHVCSKHVEAWNKLIVKQTFCASSWLITKTSVSYCYLYCCGLIPIQQTTRIFNSDQNTGDCIADRSCYDVAGFMVCCIEMTRRSELETVVTWFFVYSGVQLALVWQTLTYTQG